MTKCHQTFSPTYKPRCPEFTPCYQVVCGHLGTFLGERDRDRQSLPLHITNEFEAYLRCGIPAYGFLRMTCDGCDQEKVVAFSCKKRGWCPSCRANAKLKPLTIWWTTCCRRSLTARWCSVFPFATGCKAIANSSQGVGSAMTDAEVRIRYAGVSNGRSCGGDV